MSPQKLAVWLETSKSKEVGYKSREGDESVGHQSGRRIVELLGKAQAEFSSGDVAHAKKSDWIHPPPCGAATAGGHCGQLLALLADEPGARTADRQKIIALTLLNRQK